MFNIKKLIEKEIKQKIFEKYQKSPDSFGIIFQTPKKGYICDFTILLFNLQKQLDVETEEIKNFILDVLYNINYDKIKLIKEVKFINGFLNITLSDEIIFELFIDNDLLFETQKGNSVVEFSSPNTNKPLHLGHLRNNFIGYSISKLLDTTGNKTLKVQIINDRGIHICKSIAAWLESANGKSPEDEGLKGDKFVGKYYVEYEKIYQQQILDLQIESLTLEEAKIKAPILLKAKELLLKWESGDKEILSVWSKMNSWVYDGFNQTYAKLGIVFDKNYYESQTYLLGKNEILKGLDQGIFVKKQDGSIWVDLTEYGLNEKVLLRSDGTSLYLTQDIGTAIERHKELNFDQMMYVVGDEQDHHFNVLFATLKKLGFKWADKLKHISYGMVNLPTGKMKSREGTIVDADDLIDKMIGIVSEKTKDLNKLSDLNEEDLLKINQQIALGALKYFILKVNPKKTMLFNPEEAIDLQGNTGPFIQYTCVRINSLIKKFEDGVSEVFIYPPKYVLSQQERNLINKLLSYKELLTDAKTKLDPSMVCSYCYELACLFNKFYETSFIVKEQDLLIKNLRMQLTFETKKVLNSLLDILGIEVPIKM